VVGGGDRGVRAVAVEVTRGEELLRDDRVRAAVAGDEVLRADQLLVAVRGGEVLARGALAVPAGDLLVAELAGLPVRPDAGAVGALRVLGPDAGVDGADDQVLAGVPDAPELVPRAAGLREPEELRRRDRVGVLDEVRLDRDDAVLRRQRGRLVVRQLRREAVDREAVVVQLLAAADLRELRVVAGFPGAAALLDVSRVLVDLLALLLPRRGRSPGPPGCGA